MWKEKGEKNHIMGRDRILSSCHARGSVESGMSPVSLFPLTWEQFSSEP